MGLLPRREPKSQGEGSAETLNDARPEGPDQLQKALLGAARSARRESSTESVSGDKTRPQEVEAVADPVKAPDGDGREVAIERGKRRRLWLKRERSAVSKAEAELAEERQQLGAARAG